MSLQGLLARPKRVFYGWWMVAAGAVLGALNAGFYYYGFGAFFTPIISETGWSRAELSGVFSVARLEGGLVAPAAGFFLDRFGPRRVMFVGITVFGLGYILMSRIHSLLAFYLLFLFVLAVGNSFGTSLPPIAAVNNWFVRRRGIAMSIVTAGYGTGGGLGAFLLGYLILNHGWRTTAVVVGLLILGIGLPAAAFMRHRPEQYGLQPDGEGGPSDGGPAAGARGASGGKPASALAGRAAEIESTPRQALACGSFWLISVANVIRQTVSSSVAVHEVPFLIDRGYDLERATVLLAFTVWTSVLGRLFFGWLGDRWDRRWILACCHGMMAAGLLIMTTISDAHTPALVALFILVYGLGYGGTIPVSMAIVGEYFGRRSYGTIQGLSNAVGMTGTFIGPLVAGYTFDVTQNYVWALTAFAAVTLAGLPLFWLVHRPSMGAPKPSASTPSVGG